MALSPRYSSLIDVTHNVERLLQLQARTSPHGHTWFINSFIQLALQSKNEMFEFGSFIIIIFFFSPIVTIYPLYI
jgi:hypothetical protein